MLSGFNRALQVRAADRLRSQLPLDELTGLPRVGGLAEADLHDLCAAGGGRLAALTLVLASETSPVELTARLGAEVRRTDVLGVLEPRLLLLLVPGLDPLAGQSLVERLGRVVHGLPVDIGIAYRSGASVTGWSTDALAADATRALAWTEHLATT